MQDRHGVSGYSRKVEGGGIFGSFRRPRADEEVVESGRLAGL